jgi:hypothetical protein
VQWTSGFLSSLVTKLVIHTCSVLRHNSSQQLPVHCMWDKNDSWRHSVLRNLI